MKYTLTKRDVAILLGFIGIVILGLTYYFVYMGYSDKTKELQAANSAMQERVDVLQELVDRQDELIANTKKNNEEISVYLDKFPANYKYEDAILFGIELTDISPYSALPVIAFGDEEAIYNFEDVASIASEQVRGYIPDGGVDQSNEGEGDETAPAEGTPTSLPELKRKVISYNHTTDYAGLKNSLAYVLDKKDRCGLNINVAYDPSTGMLNGVLNVMDYYVTNTDKVYNEPEMPIVIKGTDDMFGTMSLGGARPNRLNMGEGGTINNSSTENNNTDNTDNTSEED